MSPFIYNNLNQKNLENPRIQCIICVIFLKSKKVCDNIRFESTIFSRSNQIQELNYYLMMIFLYWCPDLLLSHWSQKLSQYLKSYTVSAKIWLDSEYFLDQIKNTNIIFLVTYLFPPFLSHNIIHHIKHRKPSKNTNWFWWVIHKNSSLNTI